jgi:hypothetical protein
VEKFGWNAGFYIEDKELWKKILLLEENHISYQLKIYQVV